MTIFHKIQKTLFLTHFGTIFPNLTRPTNMQSFTKKQQTNSEKTSGRKDGRTDGPKFIGPFQPRPGFIT